MTIHMKAINCLLITTSNNQLGDSLNKTGVWLEDLAAPYYVFRDAGEYITIASPQGGEVPLDPICRSKEEETGDTKRFQEDPQAMYHFSHSLPLKEVNAENFDLALVAGGYGAMWDFPKDVYLKHLLDDLIGQGKPVGLVGHAVVALIALKAKNGDPFVKGRGITGFSNREERLMGVGEAPPFLLETKLLSLGAYYRSGTEFTSYVVVDENIITGQNPGSAVETATRLLEWVHARERDTESLVEKYPSHNGIK
jgi:putative intracellular protease/amidase